MWLGINYNGMHDSSIALIDRQGDVVLALSEERLSRVKKDGRFPTKSLQLLDLKLVNTVALPYLWETPAASHGDTSFAREMFALPNRVSPMPEFWHKKALSLGLPIRCYDHHQCHAAAGFYFSGYHDALVVTLDAGAPNCAWSATVYLADSKGLNFVTGAPIADLWPLVKPYSDATAILGYKPNKHEGKLTGLAAHGMPNQGCEELLWDISCELGRREVNKSAPLLYEWNSHFTDDIPVLTVNPEVARECRDQLRRYSDADIAHAAQALLTNKLMVILAEIRSTYPSESIVLSGGAFANVKLNLDVKHLGYKHIFVCPPMGDEGLSLGAGILAWSDETGGTLNAKPLHNLYLGIAPSASVISELDDLGITYHLETNIPHFVAKCLANDKTVAVVRGRMEYGPRALGNRSILYRANDPSVNDWLNKKLKRTEFMPFAPIVRAEDAEALFVTEDLVGSEHTAEYMTICMRCTDVMRIENPAVVHLDGTARPQLVTKNNAPFLHEVLSEYASLTGSRALINTSFNVHDEPIVATVRDAIRAFSQSGLDYLVFEDAYLCMTDNLKSEVLGLNDN